MAFMAQVWLEWLLDFSSNEQIANDLCSTPFNWIKHPSGLNHESILYKILEWICLLFFVSYTILELCKNIADNYEMIYLTIKRE